MGWGLAALVWGYALLLFVMTDFAKVRLYKLLNREGKKVEGDEAANALRKGNTPTRPLFSAGITGNLSALPQKLG